MRPSRLALCAVLLAAAPTAGNAELAGHRAVYSLALETARGDVVAAGGTMAYEVIDACDGWAVRQRLSISISSRNGRDVELQSDYATWEAKDGLSMRFRMRQTTDGAVASEVAGTASIARVGGGGEAVYSQPADTTHTLPDGTTFPMAHTEAILAAARAGQRFIAIPLFDGTSADGAQDSTVAIAGWTPPAANAWPALSALPSARVRIAFFERGGDKQQPEYEVGMRYWENGIADQLAMDFGDYVLSGRLVELAVAKPGC